MTQIIENPHVALNNARNLPRDGRSEPRKSESVAFNLTLSVSAAAGEKAVIEFCIAHLRKRGYYVAPPDAPWESNGAFCKRVGLYPHRIREAIVRYELRKGPPIGVEARGKSGRIIAIQSNPSFDNFCRTVACGPRSKQENTN